MNLSNDFKGRDFISIHDFTTEEVNYFLDVADGLKKELKSGKELTYLKNKTLGMIFEKSSTRTRVSFETGMYYLGGNALFLSGRDLQIGRGEPIEDTARVFSRYLHGIMIRTYSHENVLKLAEYASVPVINGLTDLLHPCQVLADAQTIREHLGDPKGLKLSYVGDGNNMANSLMYIGAKLGMNITIVCPKGYEPNANVVNNAKEDAKKTGATIEVEHDLNAGVKDANVVYTDVWASMGQEEEAIKRKKVFANYQVNEELLQNAQKDAIVMHCLPAHRGEEITAETLEKHQEVIFDEAENRLFAQMAVMALLI